MSGANSRYRRREGQVAAICLLLIVITLIVAVPSPCLAAIKVFEREYTYQASEADSKLSSRTVSLAEVKRLLLEELGTYLESITEVKNFQLTKDQITALTAGIVRVEVLNEHWDGKTYWLKARIAADPDDVVKSLDSLRKDREKSRELEEVKKRVDSLLAENKRLKDELKTAKGEITKKKREEYSQVIKGLNATEWFQRGTSLWESEKYDGAIEAFTKAIELNPKYAKAYRNRGITYASLGNYRQAIKELDKAIELDPKNALAYVSRGLTYASLGNYKRAIEDYDRAIELDPKAVVAYVSRGIAYAKLGNYRQAIEDYDRAIELDPKAAVAYFNRGIAYAKLGNYRQAIEDFDRTIELDQKDAEAYNYRGATYAELGNYRQAIEDYNRAIELDPKEEVTYYLRGLTYADLGNYQQAIRDLKIAARLGHEGAQNWLREKGIDW
ncbi:MAG: tetratricopeptide repeat protein [Syntrophobacterales bacterium]|nr:tetratricopeptide repeat protein [Syntrophobacterales bacterium]